jgi:hypothetical protein
MAGGIPIQQYYQEKYGWTSDIFNDLSWKIQAAVLQTYTQEDQTRIIKFVHGWPPTQNRKVMEGTANSTKCRLCHALIKDNTHMFGCQHRNMQRHLEDLSWKIQKMQEDNGDSKLTNIIEIGIKESGGKHTWTPDMGHVSNKWISGIKEQNRIGWQHILYVRLSKKLIMEMDSHYFGLAILGNKYTGERWARTLIRHIWDTMLDLWRERNSLLNERDKSAAQAQHTEQMEKRVGDDDVMN